MKIIKKVDKEEFQDFLYHLDLNDTHLYEELNNNDTIGIFQFNGALASGITKQVKPKNFNEMIAINSLARPGTSSFTEDYISGKDEGVTKYPKLVNSLLEETYGLCIFQEQIMSIFNVIGGFSLEETNDIRGLMKRLGKAEKKQKDLDKWDASVKKFIKGAIDNGLSEAEANNISEDLLRMSEYSFNKCFSGDSVIDRDNKARWSPTIEEMYKTKNDKKWAKENGHISLYRKYNRQGYGYAKSLNEDSRLYANKIIDIYFEGKRDVFRITLENGKYIDVTSNHNFPVSSENNSLEYKSIDSGLKIGNSLFCNGCHKKEHYKEGRKKKNTKGSLTKLYKIADIKYIGKKNTYNVEMEAPYHTLSVNSIVAKNSHATAYSYIAAITLYLSYYYKEYFLSSVLQNHIDDKKDVFSTIQSVRNQGLEVLPPDINKSNKEVTSINKKQLLLGLKNIKKLSNTSAPHIIEKRPFYSLFDFITGTEGKKIRIDVIKALVSVGAFDFETPERKRLLLAVDMFWKNKKSIKVKEKLKIIWDKVYNEAFKLKGLNMTNTDLKDFENEYLGGNFFTSSFPKEMLQAFSKLKKRQVIYYSLNETTAIPKKIPLFIQEIKNHIDKNNNEMAFITVEDVLGKNERFPIFASYWQHIKNLLEEDTAYFLQIYLTENGNLFGTPKWTQDEKKIKRMVKKIEVLEDKS